MKPTPLTDQIALDTRVEFGSIEKLLASHRSLERDRAELIEALRELHNQFDGMAEYQKEQEYSEAEMVQMFQVIANRARALLSRLGADK